MNPTEAWSFVSSQYSSITEKYMTGIMLAGLVFSLLNCFMGYKLRKIWGSILGFLLGAAAGGGLGYYYLHDAKYALAIGAAGAVVIALLAWLFYKLGIFVLCTGLVYALTVSFFSAPGSTQRIICVVLGIFAATLALGYEEYVIIGITGVCGGIGAINLLFELTGKNGGLGTWILGLILAFLGIAVQAAPLLKNRRRRQDVDFFEGRKRRRKSFSLPSLPSLPGRRRKVKKKTVYKKENRREEASSGKSGSSSGKKLEKGNKGSDRKASESMSENPERNSGTEYAGKSGSSTYTGVDLDDLSKELSQEIQKIYQDEQDI